MHKKDNQPTDADRDRDVRLSAHVLGQLDDEQRRLLEVDLQANVKMRNRQEDLLRVAGALSHQHAAEALPTPSPELRNAIQEKLAGDACLADKPAKPTRESTRWSRRRVVIALAVTACLLMLLAIPMGQGWRTRQATDDSALVQFVLSSAKDQAAHESDFVELSGSEIVLTEGQSEQSQSKQARLSKFDEDDVIDNFASSNFTSSDARPTPPVAVVPSAPLGAGGQPRFVPAAGQPGRYDTAGYDGGLVLGSEVSGPGKSGRGISGPGMGDRADQRNVTLIQQRGTTVRTETEYGLAAGTRVEHNVAPVDNLSVVISGKEMSESISVPTIKGQAVRGFTGELLSQIPPHVASPSADRTPDYYYSVEGESESRFGRDMSRRRYRNGQWYYQSPPGNRERYEAIVENPFVSVSQQALSTLSIDVDTASYANMRRFLSQNQLPPANAIRIEELINYFSYDYPGPEDDQPFATHLEVTECPWRPNHRLVRVGLQGRRVAREERPGCNLVFLLDVSGSMKDANKLPLLKQAMKLLVDQLGENDRVAIVTYASQAGVRLKSTVADKHDVIHEVINGLNANGSTNGGAGIEMAYEQALAGAIEGGINRVILATDGDLNVGITDDDALVRLIKEKAASGVFLTVLGFGQGNYQDAKLEKLADNGNGIYAYIDGWREARKVLVEQVEGSLVTIARDVKIKVEFNPAEVQAYRLIGYENRLMTAAEFDDDKKDAGEIGAGHSVTAIYEIVPAAPAQLAAAETLKYQRPATPIVPKERLSDAAKSGELLTLSLRYKLPDSDEGTLVEVSLLNTSKRFSEASMDFRFATAVASFGMLLRDSVHRGDTSFAAVEEIASAAIGDDQGGYRTEFLDLVRRAATMK